MRRAKEKRGFRPSILLGLLSPVALTRPYGIEEPTRSALLILMYGSHSMLFDVVEDLDVLAHSIIAHPGVGIPVNTTVAIEHFFCHVAMPLSRVACACSIRHARGSAVYLRGCGSLVRAVSLRILIRIRVEKGILL